MSLLSSNFKFKTPSIKKSHWTYSIPILNNLFVNKWSLSSILMRKEPSKFNTFPPLWIKFKQDSLPSNPNKLENGSLNSVVLDYHLYLLNQKSFTMAFFRSIQTLLSSEIHSSIKFKWESNSYLSLLKIITFSNFWIFPKPISLVFNRSECFKFHSLSFLLNVQDTIAMYW